MTQYTSSLSRLRYDRTRRSNQVRNMIGWMLKEHAPYINPDGLPSWWPFWSDCLKTSTRDLVRAARLVSIAETPKVQS